MSDDLPETLPQLLRLCAARFGDRQAVTSRDGLRTTALTYRDLEKAAISIAADLTTRHRLTKGQRVILMAPSSVRTVAALFGLFTAGIIAVPLDLNSTPAFVEAVLEKTGAAAIVSAQRLAVPAVGRHIALEDLSMSGATAPVAQEPGPDDIAEIVFTSGTTGEPKGVVLKHRNILTDLRAASDVVPPGEEMKLVSILPISHMFEQTVGLFLPLLKGGTVHYAPSLKPSAIAGEIQRRQATGMLVVPRFLELLMAAVESRARSRGLERVWDLQHSLAARLPMNLRRLVFLPLHRGLGGKLRYFLCGGAPLSPGLMRAWERTGVRIIEGYGATECAPVIASNTFEDRVPGSIGRPLRGVSVRLSEEGELQVCGGNVFEGYWKDQERTRAAFTPDGWYRTDDVAETASEDRLRIVGRLSERIVLPSGMNVYPIDVEAELDRQPEIKECAVISVPDNHGGNRLHALIRPVDGERADVSPAVKRANASLASHQRVNGFTLWEDDFPKTALQKIRRKRLQEEFEAKDRSAGDTPLAASEDLVGRLIRRVARTTPTVITPEMRLDLDLGLDSLGRVELATEIETETGREIDEEAVARVATVGELAAFLAAPGTPANRVALARWPRNPAISLLRRVLQPVALFLPHRAFARPYVVTGRAALEDVQEPCLVVANHASHADTLAILRALPTHLRCRTAVAAAADYFFARRWAAVLAEFLLAAFPFSREGRVRESLENCGLIADEGWSILIYPEGTRSLDGRVLPFKSGIGLLASGLRVPVVPIAVTGGARLLPKGTSRPRRAAVAVHIGQPVRFPPEMPPEIITADLQKRVTELLEDTEKREWEGPRHA